jgi:putative PIN family toxin of toxin-antitoxin system
VRVFLDTNVLVAAFATRGLCADLVRTIVAEHELLSSPTVLQELKRTLTEKVRVPDQKVRQIVAFLRVSATLVDVPPGRAPVEIRDPDDAIILGEALAGGAAVLVTGDKDLLDLGEIPGLRIVNPRGFWESVRRRSP